MHLFNRIFLSNIQTFHWKWFYEDNEKLSFAHTHKSAQSRNVYIIMLNPHLKFLPVSKVSPKKCPWNGDKRIVSESELS